MPNAGGKAKNQSINQSINQSNQSSRVHWISGTDEAGFPAVMPVHFKNFIMAIIFL